MVQTNISNTIVNAMLSWLKGLAGWVLRLFNLSGGGSPLEFLAKNWIIILGILMAIGVITDLVVWLVRWRPHWVWFRKKRVVINDDNFFKHENDIPLGNERKRRRSGDRNWVDHEYIVPGSATRKRASERVKRPAEHRQAPRRNAVHRDVFSDDRFNVNAKQRFTDRYESEVFNVSDLPDRAVKSERRTRRENTIVPRVRENTANTEGTERSAHEPR